MNKLAPIVLFVYNRLNHTKQTIVKLQKNDLAYESDLIIYSDAAKNEEEEKKVKEVREYIKTVVGFKKIEIIERSENWGLANSIIDGATTIINKYGKIIILEDDLLTSSNFLIYMNQALDKYKQNQEIFSISGFNFDNKYLSIPHDYIENIFFHPRPMSWSWATWENRWNECDWEIKKYDQLKRNNKYLEEFKKIGPDLPNMLDLHMKKKIDSWYVRFCFNAFKNHKLTVYPIKSLISNIGHDGTGVHCSNDDDGKYLNSINTPNLNIDQTFFPDKIIINNTIVNEFNQNFVPKKLFIRVLKIIKSKFR